MTYPFGGAVLLETDLGVLTVDVSNVASTRPFVREFIRLCEAGYYRNSLIYSVEKDFVCYCGDRTGTGKDGVSFRTLCARAGVIDSEGDAGLDEAFDHINDWKHCDKSYLLCALRTIKTPSVMPSIFFITLSNDLAKYSHLMHDHAVIGRIAEDESNVIKQLSTTYVDDKFRPLRDIRLRKSVVLVHPSSVQPLDPKIIGALNAVASNPEIDVPEEEWDRIEERPSILAQLTLGHEDEAVAFRKKEEILAETRAIELEILGALTSAEAKPMENVLFVCKLNPVTRSEDLRTIFSRFGEITDCEVKRDAKTKESLGYAFIAFATKAECEEAYKKMQDVVVDGRRIRVDFSQSEGKRGPALSKVGSKPPSSHRSRSPPRRDLTHDARRRRSRSPPPPRDSRDARRHSRSPQRRRSRSEHRRPSPTDLPERSGRVESTSGSSTSSESSREKRRKSKKHRKKKHRKHHRS